MKDVFDVPAQDAPQGETQADETQVQSTEDAAPPAADTETHVPLKALEAERSKRREWRDVAMRLQGQIEARERMQQPTGQQPQEVDPIQAAEARFQNLTLNASERLARLAHGSEVVDKAFETFQQAVAKDPTLHQRAMQQADPWDFVVREGKRMAFLEEVGDDPAAYRTKLEAELRAQITGTAPTRPQLPQSLAGARSTAARTAPVFAGPPDLKDIFG